MKLLKINDISFLAGSHEEFVERITDYRGEKIFVAPIRTIDLFATFFNKKKRAYFSSLTYAWPSTQLCRAALRFLEPHIFQTTRVSRSKRKTIESNALLVDLLIYHLGKKEKPFFVTARHEVHRDFTHKIQRILPEFKAGGMLASEIANTQFENTIELIKKAAPTFVFMGPDVIDPTRYIEAFKNEQISTKIIYFGSDEFKILIGLKNGPTPFFRHLGTEPIYFFLQNPSLLFKWPIYVFAIFPLLLLLKLRKKFTVIDISNVE